MKRSTERILTTHVGSLPRPPALIQLAAKKQTNQPYNEQDYAEVLRGSVGGVVRTQAEIGIDVVDDGEFGKASWTGYVTERLAGFEPRPVEAGASMLQRGKDWQDFAEFYDEALRTGTLWHATVANPPSLTGVQWVCTGPITYAGRAILQQDIDNFKAALAEVNVADAFMPVAAPASIEPGRTNEYYPSEEAYVYALADAMKEEYAAIIEAGFLVQIDDAWIPALWDRLLPAADLERYRTYCMLRIEALNHALAGIPQERIRYHICWGSWHGPHTTDIPMQDIVDLMLKVNAGAYAFEAANARHEHEYHVWEDIKLPEGKVLIPGVVSHATNVVEHPELVAERIVRFAERVGNESVLAGTDCGLGGRVHPQIAWAKLGALVEGAHLATRSLRFA